MAGTSPYPYCSKLGEVIRKGIVELQLPSITQLEDSRSGEGFGDRRNTQVGIGIHGAIATNFCRPVASRPGQFLIDDDTNSEPWEAQTLSFVAEMPINRLDAGRGEKCSHGDRPSGGLWGSATTALYTMSIRYLVGGVEGRFRYTMLFHPRDPLLEQGWTARSYRLERDVARCSLILL